MKPIVKTRVLVPIRQVQADDRILVETGNLVPLDGVILEGDCMDASIDPCSTVTKITSFVESLNLKKYGNLFGRLKDELFPPAKPLPA